MVSSGLSTIALDHIRKRPAHVLQLLVILEVNAVLGDDSNGVCVQTAGIAVIENLHALLDDVDGLFAGKTGGGLLVRCVAAHDGLSEHGADAGGETGGRIGSAEEVGGGEEGLVIVVEASNEDMVPERVELGSTAVEELGEVGVEVGGGEANVGVGLLELEIGQVAVDVLHVGDVAAEADDGRLGEGTEALDVGVAGHGAVGACVVGHTDCQFLEGGKGGKEGRRGTNPGCRRR